MKKLIPLLFFIWMISCESEQILVDRIVYIDSAYMSRKITSVSLDSIRTISTKSYIEYRDSLVIDTVYIEGKDSIIERIVEIEVIKYDTIETVRVDTVERESTITYLLLFAPYVNNFFLHINREHSLNVDVYMDTIPLIDTSPYADSDGFLKDGGITILLRQDGCYEGAVYRELLHFLYTADYIGHYEPAYPDNPFTDFVMTQNWPKCLEDMSEEERDGYLTFF